MKTLREVIDGLKAKGYSEESANIIAAQWASKPDDRRYWGTEEQTRKDIEDILNKP